MGEEALFEARVKAAKASRGISCDTIYSRIEQIIRRLDLHGNALDFGAGAGHFTQRLVSMKYFDRVAAADILARPPSLPAEVIWEFADLNVGLPDIPSRAFDLVVAAEVIEHLENPRAVARELYRILKSGGTLILTTPNNESWRALGALALRGHFVHFGDSSYPAHITALLRKDLTRVLDEAGFSTLRIEFSDAGGMPWRPATTWQSISFGLLKGLRYSDNLIVTTRKP